MRASVNRLCWKPSFDTISTLRQLGIPQRELERLIVQYGTVCPEPDDEDFRLFAMRHSAAPTTIQTVCRPTPQALSALQSRGYSPVLLNALLDEFLMAKTEINEVVVDADAAFTAFVARNYSLKREKPLSKAGWKELVLQGYSPETISSAITEIRRTTRSDPAKIPETDLQAMIRALAK